MIKLNERELEQISVIEQLVTIAMQETNTMLETFALEKFNNRFKRSLKDELACEATLACQQNKAYLIILLIDEEGERSWLKRKVEMDPNVQ